MKLTDNEALNLFQKFAAQLFRRSNSVTRKKGAHDFMEDIIKPTSFYSRESEKTKLNWFCYEMALSIELGIRRNLGKQLMKYKIDDKAIAEFSIYYSNVMKDIVLQKLSGKIKTVIMSYEPIEFYFPMLNDRMVGKMLDVISKAWEGQLDVCVICPNRCLSEKEKYCPMFDNGFYK
jgi:hypothetical protein